MNSVNRFLFFLIFFSISLSARASYFQIQDFTLNRGWSNHKFKNLDSEASSALKMYSQREGFSGLLTVYPNIDWDEKDIVLKVNYFINGKGRYFIKIQKNDGKYETLQEVYAEGDLNQEKEFHLAGAIRNYIYEGKIRIKFLGAEFCNDMFIQSLVFKNEIQEKESISKGMSFYWQLQGLINTSLSSKVYNIDLEDNSGKSVISNLKSKNKLVICYFSAGTYENWRDDAHKFPVYSRGKQLPNWPDEQWVDIRLSEVRNIMKERMKKAVEQGCDAVEPDNVDGYINDNGLEITEYEQIEYLHWLAKEARALGLSIGLKNALDIIEKGQLYDHFDWALNEKCYQYSECEVLLKFIEKGKAVFIAEYDSKALNFCTDAKEKQFFLARFNYELAGKRYDTCE